MITLKYTLFRIFYRYRYPNWVKWISPSILKKYPFGGFPLPINQFDRPADRPIPDQAVHDFFRTTTRPYTTPKRPLTTPPRLQPDNHSNLYSINPVPTRSLLDQLDLCSTNTQSLPDGSTSTNTRPTNPDPEPISRWSGNDRVLVE